MKDGAAGHSKGGRRIPCDVRDSGATLEWQSLNHVRIAKKVARFIEAGHFLVRSGEGHTPVRMTYHRVLVATFTLVIVVAVLLTVAAVLLIKVNSL